MKLNSRKFWQNKWLKVTALAIGALLIVFAGLWASVASLRQQYKTDFSAWNTQLHKTFETQGKKIEANRDPQNVTAVLEELQKILKEWNLPAEPKTLGVSVLSLQAKQARTATKAQADKAASAIDEVKSVLRYQAEVVAPIQALSGKSAQNLEQLKALEAQWRAKTAELDKVNPPLQLKDFHQTLKQNLESIATDLSALIPLFEKQDVNGFNAKKDELNNKIAALQALGDQFAGLAKAQDNNLAKQLHELNHSLESLSK